MPRLLINPRSSAAWEIELKPGTNLLGRGFANDFKIDDPSVSSSHCQILVDQANVLIKDLNSTNGTFVNRAPVKEAALQPGQTIHLGGVEILFDASAAVRLLDPSPGATAPVRLAEPAATPAPVRLQPATAGAPQPVRLSFQGRTPAAAEVSDPPEAPPLAPPPMAPAGIHAGAHFCKFHPKSPGRYFCAKCSRYFCEFCVTARGEHRICRHCGVDCAPVEFQISRPKSKGSFFRRLPGAFIYPFKGSGVLILLVATLIFAGLDVVGGGYSILFMMLAIGYLFSYMQNIIHATASEEDTMPDMPGMDGLFGAFFTLAGVVAFCFGLPIGLAIAKFFFDVEEIPTSAIFATLGLGSLYFPMAFLAVAMKDTVAAANPLVVIPAIVKVPFQYLVTAFILGCVFVVRFVGAFVMAMEKSAGYHTRDMSTLFISFGIRAVGSLLAVYVLTVGMRVLGLLYSSNKHKFGWFSR